MLESKDDFEKQALDVSNDASYITWFQPKKNKESKLNYLKIDLWACIKQQLLMASIEIYLLQLICSLKVSLSFDGHKIWEPDVCYFPHFPNCQLL